MTEKLNIVQSTTEPDKRNIWLKDNELKKFGAKGWSTIGGKGGGASLDDPQVSELSGSELIPINDNGKNKVITVNNLLNSGKDVCKIILDDNDENLVNYSEVRDAIMNGNKCFIRSVLNDIDKPYGNALISIILYVTYQRVSEEVTLSILIGNLIRYYTYSIISGELKKVDGPYVLPHIVTLSNSSLDTGATLENVVTAYNNLVDKLKESGLVSRY